MTTISTTMSISEECPQDSDNTNPEKLSIFDPENITASPEAELSPQSIHGFRWAIAIASLYSSALLYGLDTTIVAGVQVAIIEACGHIDQLTWIGAGFPLGSVAVILPIGVLYGLFNTKWIYISSFLMFEVGSALCGAAPSMNALIIGRAIAGIGGAGTYLG